MLPTSQIILHFLLIGFIYSYYSFYDSKVYSTNIKSVVLAPYNFYYKNPNTSSLTIFNMAIAFKNNSISLVNAQRLYEPSVYTFNSNISFYKLEWNQLGLVLISNKSVTIYDPHSIPFSQLLTINTNSSNILSAKALKKSYLQILTFIAFENRIEIYGKDILIKSINLLSAFQSMAIDETLAYLYYFDQKFRYVYNINNDQLQYQSYVNYLFKQTVSNVIYNFGSNAVISLGQNGKKIEVWDRASSMFQLSFQKQQSKIMICKDQAYFLSYEVSSEIHVWKIYGRTKSSWKIIQNISLSQSLINYDAKGQYFIYCTQANRVNIYNYITDPTPQPDPSPTPSLSTAQIALTIFFFFFGICFIIFCFKKTIIRNRNQRQPLLNVQNAH